LTLICGRRFRLVRGCPRPSRNGYRRPTAPSSKRKSANYQIQVGVVFRYERCPELQDEGAIGLLASSWLGCKPLIDLALPIQ
jgi:hypothetical protein